MTLALRPTRPGVVVVGGLVCGALGFPSFWSVGGRAFCGMCFSWCRLTLSWLMVAMGGGVNRARRPPWCAGDLDGARRGVQYSKDMLGYGHALDPTSKPSLLSGPLINWAVDQVNKPTQHALVLACTLSIPGAS